MIAWARAIRRTAVAAAALLGASIASAQEPTPPLAAEPTVVASQVAASLAYSRAETASTCPDDTALKDAVQRQLGYPVFERAPVTRVLEVSVARARGRFVARLALRSATGDALGSREIESRGTTCDELADALGLAIALALDPSPMPSVAVETSVPAVETPVAVAPAPCPVAAPCPAPAACPVCPAPPPPAPLAWKVGFGGALGVGALPSVALALELDVALRLGGTELLVEGVVYPETESTASATPLETQAQVARLGLCQWLLTGKDLELAACALGGFGVLRGASPNALDRSLTLVGTAGVRAAAELRVVGPVWVQARTDLHANLAATTLSLGDTVLWETPALFLELSILGVVRFS